MSLEMSNQHIDLTYSEKELFLIKDVFPGGMNELQARIKEAWQIAEKQYKNTNEQDREMFYKSNSFYTQIFGSREYCNLAMKDNCQGWKRIIAKIVKELV